MNVLHNNEDIYWPTGVSADIIIVAFLVLAFFTVHHTKRTITM